MLLALEEREATLSDLGKALDPRAGATRRASRRLAARGLVRWHHTGRLRRTTVGITPAGLATIRALLTAAGQAAARDESSR